MVVDSRKSQGGDMEGSSFKKWGWWAIGGVVAVVIVVVMVVAAQPKAQLGGEEVAKGGESSEAVADETEPEGSASGEAEVGSETEMVDSAEALPQSSDGEYLDF